MYLHPAFKIDVAEALPILRERAFGLFVVPTADAPFGVHLPFLVDELPEGGLRVHFHVARANPIHEHVGAGCKALLACQGPDAYISPDWYGVENQVPTWTYTAVHLKGTARTLSTADNIDHVDRLAAQFEARLLPKKPWTSDKMDRVKLKGMLKGIVAIALDVEEVAAQKKLNQHKGEAEHRGAIAGLRARGDADAAAIADMMAENAERKFGG